MTTMTTMTTEQALRLRDSLKALLPGRTVSVTATYWDHAGGRQHACGTCTAHPGLDGTACQMWAFTDPSEALDQVQAALADAPGRALAAKKAQAALLAAEIAALETQGPTESQAESTRRAA